MRRFAMLLMISLLLPIYALAAPDIPYAADTVLQVDALTPAAQSLLDLIYPAIRNCEMSITLPKRTLYDDANAAMQCLSRNYPELFHLERTWSISYYQSEPQYAAGIQPSYSISAEEYNHLLTQLLSAAQALADSAAGSQADRAEYLHDVLCLRATYDYSETGQMNNTVVGSLLMGATQCEGYAHALTLLYRLSGIPCGVVTGEAMDEWGPSRHAWNIAAIDGVSTLIDATWNDQDSNYGVTHWYYGLTTAMMAVDHMPDPELAVPACHSTAVNWHARRGLLLSNRDEILYALGCFARDGEVSVRFTDAAMYADFRDRTNDWFGEYNAACQPENAFYGAYNMIFADQQLCLQLWRIKEDAVQ